MSGKKGILTGAFDIDEVHIVGCRMNHCPECHRVCYLTVKPDILVGGEEEGQFWANNTDDIAKHWNENEATVVG